MFYVNINTQLLVTSATDFSPLPKNFRPKLRLADSYALQFQLLTAPDTPLALNAADLFYVAGDLNFIHTDELLFLGETADCSVIDALNGIIEVTFNTETPAFSSKITRENTEIFLEIGRYVAGSARSRAVLLDRCYAMPCRAYTIPKAHPAVPIQNI